jgi:hypothetical protein
MTRNKQVEMNDERKKYMCSGAQNKKRCGLDVESYDYFLVTKNANAPSDIGLPHR